MISREEAIRIIRKRFCSGDTDCNECCYSPEYCIYAVVIEALSEPERPADPWIPCSERLPNTTDNVLITTQYGVILTVFRGMSGKWCYLDGRRLDSQDTPVAWMPLPEPYKGVTK